MKLLIITNNPDRASFRQRGEVYLDQLLKQGIEPYVEKFPAGALSRIKLLMGCGCFDGVLLHKKRLNPLDAFLLRRYAKKVIYDFDDAVMYSDKHPNEPDRKRLVDFERTVKLADLVIAGNKYLADHARKFNLNVEVLPTGLNLAEYNIKTRKPSDGKIRLVWIGSESTLGYLHELAPVFEEIGKRFDNVVLRIICDKFFSLNNMRVQKCPWSLQTQVNNLLTSDIGLAPLPDNNFTRGKCGFKILQYFAAGLPVIASPVGVNRQLCGDGRYGFLAGDYQQWIDKILLLREDAEIREQMGLAAKDMVKQFDLSLIGDKLADIVRGCIGGVRF